MSTLCPLRATAMPSVPHTVPGIPLGRPGHPRMVMGGPQVILHVLLAHGGVEGCLRPTQVLRRSTTSSCVARRHAVVFLCVLWHPGCVACRLRCCVGTAGRLRCRAYTVSTPWASYAILQVPRVTLSVLRVVHMVVRLLQVVYAGVRTRRACLGCPAAAVGRPPCSTQSSWPVIGVLGVPHATHAVLRVPGVVLGMLRIFRTVVHMSPAHLGCLPPSCRCRESFWTCRGSSNQMCVRGEHAVVRRGHSLKEGSWKLLVLSWWCGGCVFST